MLNLHIAWKVQTNHLEFCYLILLEGMKIQGMCKQRKGICRPSFGNTVVIKPSDMSL